MQSLENKRKGRQLGSLDPETLSTRVSGWDRGTWGAGRGRRRVEGSKGPPGVIEDCYCAQDEISGGLGGRLEEKDQESVGLRLRTVGWCANKSKTRGPSKTTVIRGRAAGTQRQ